MTAQVLGLPGVLAYPLFYKLVEPGASVVTKEAMQDWMKQRNILLVRLPVILGFSRDGGQALVPWKASSSVGGVNPRVQGLVYLSYGQKHDNLLACPLYPWSTNGNA